MMKNGAFTSRKFPGWLKWSLLIVLLLVVIFLVFAIYLYTDIRQSKESGYEETRQQLLANTSLTEITAIEQFNGAQSYHVVHGINGEVEEKIVFYPLKGNEKNLTTIDKSEIVPETQVQSQWQEQCSNCELIEVVPALSDGNALWEVTFIDENGQYVFDYLSIYDGTRYEQYRFTSMFN